MPRGAAASWLLAWIRARREMACQCRVTATAARPAPKPVRSRGRCRPTVVCCLDEGRSASTLKTRVCDAATVGVLSLSIALGAGAPAVAAGLESVESPFAFEVPGGISDMRKKAAAADAAAEEAFQNSDLLRSLKEKSEANKSDNKRSIEDKYCYRQAELGIGDCGGLRYLQPKKKPPKFIMDLFGLTDEDYEVADIDIPGFKFPE
ncbi:unnamed protein product [Pedinophyceae sp. YPF-701]|nr:unnamed protein product [Pedinophyceae sp. YPF-701]